ncbi:hypothetical protein GGR55DRAFT_180386 [Xylaria sp. FL0064]|nr:hypothetical protein GGR55DRAFT_180386 [Xylaria sp. FL0064]
MATLRYLTLPSNPSALLPKFPSYASATHVQTALQHEFLAWKARAPSARGPPPPPSILCFTPSPTYTLGRRQTEPLSEVEVARLRSALFVSESGSEGRSAGSNNNDDGRHDIGRPGKAGFFLPTITHAPRGGLTTYHGPGQLVIWPVIDLHSPLHAHLSVRDYACLLEKTTIATLEKMWGLVGFTTENPGVWVRRSGGSRGAAGEGRGGDDAGGVERKIAALGVHLRRHVTGLGVAINYSTPVSGPAEINPWGRIVACGLGDREVTSVRAELGVRGSSNSISQENDDHMALQGLGETWRAEFQKRLKFREDADSMVASDNPESLKYLSAQLKQLKDTDGLQVEARPFSALET